MSNPETVVTKTILIDAPASSVWDTLTNPDVVREWLSDSGITVSSEWKVGSPIRFAHAWHNGTYEDKGIILKFEPHEIFRYSHWSPVSNAPDSPENYSVIEFRLAADPGGTLLTLTHSNLVHEAQFEHSNYYWTVALHQIKRVTENPGSTSSS